MVAIQGIPLKRPPPFLPQQVVQVGGGGGRVGREGLEGGHQGRGGEGVAQVVGVHAWPKGLVENVGAEVGVTWGALINQWH